MLNVVKSLHDLPALFLVSQQDTTIAPNHSEELYSEHSCGEKKLHFINGLHNESRDENYMQYIKNYIEQVIGNDKRFPDKMKRQQRYRRLALDELHLRNRERSTSQELSNSCVCSIFQPTSFQSPNILKHRK
jgi:hypothetical protein